jgi:serine/threonine-protein kinase
MRDGNVVLDLPQGGSIAYTAPERLHGGAGDRRSDVWSLGVMLWEALAHVRLFEGTTDEALRKAVETAEIVPVNEMNANVPSELGAICTKALQRDPAGRYQSAKVLAAEISAVLDDAGYPEGTDAIAKWIAKELPVVAAAPPSSIPPSAAVPAPLQPTPAKLHNQTMMGMAPFGQDLKPPVQAPKDNKTQPLTMMDIIDHRPATPSVIPLDNPIVPLDIKKVHDTLPDNKPPAFLAHKPDPKPGSLTAGWEVVPEPKPQPEVKPDPPRAKSDSKSSLPSWATRPSGSQPPPLTPAVTPAQPIAPTVPFSPSQTLQGVSNPGIKPPPDGPAMKLPDAPPGATVSADKPSAFNTTSIVGSSLSNAIPGLPAAFSGNRTATMGSNAIIDAVNASVSAGESSGGGLRLPRLRLPWCRRLPWCPWCPRLPWCPWWYRRLRWCRRRPSCRRRPCCQLRSSRRWSSHR